MMTMIEEEVRLVDLQDLIRLPKQGVWCIVNEEQGKVLILHAVSVFEAIARNLRMFNERSHTYQADLEGRGMAIWFLESTIDDIVTQKIRVQKWIDKYSNSGYSVLNTRRESSLKLFETIHEYRCVLYIRNRMSKEILVGVFDTLDEMNVFKERYYSNGITDLVYASNKGTKAYYEQSRQTNHYRGYR